MKLLREVVARRCPQYLPAIEDRQQLLRDDARDAIADALNDEFSLLGTDENGEVTEEGVALDELMGAFAWDDPATPFPGFQRGCPGSGGKGT
jgi:hypothetical protein